jgi:hypothetical protein
MSKRNIQTSDLPSAVATVSLQNTQVALGNVSGVIACDLSQGLVFVGTITGDIAGVTFTNWPSSPALVEPLLILTQDGTGGHAITLSTVSWLPSGSNPVFDSTIGHVNYIPLSSKDQGTTIYGDTTSGDISALQSSVSAIQSSISGLSTLEANVSALQTYASNSLYIVENGASTSVTRPSVPGKVLWVGSATPSQSIAGDLQSSSITILGNGPPQSVQNVGSAAPGSAVTSFTIPITNLPSVGHTLLLAVATDGTPVVSSVSDPRSNTWTVDVTNTTYTGAAISIVRATVTNAYQSNDNLTVTLSGSTAGAGYAQIQEFTALPSSPVDNTASNYSTTAVTALDAGTTATTTEAIELVVAAWSISGATGGFTPGGGYTVIGGGGGTRYLEWTYLVTSSTGAQHPTATIGTGRAFSGAVVAYKGS